MLMILEDLYDEDDSKDQVKDHFTPPFVAAIQPMSPKMTAMAIQVAMRALMRRTRDGNRSGNIWREVSANNVLIGEILR
jgi:hypothetical protein